MSTIDERIDRVKPFPRPTERLQQAERYSQELADSMYHSFIGTRHMLISILLMKSGPAWDAMQEAGVDALDLANKIREAKSPW